jgi:HAD superfamily hydrolase (TIGR01458 family)
LDFLHPALSHVRAVVFDLGGTLYEGDAPVLGVPEVVRALRAGGVAVRFLTNTTSQSRRALIEKLRAMGLSVGKPEHLHGPPAAAGAFLRERNASAHVLVPEAAREDFDGVTQGRDLRGTAPDYVVVGDLGDEWTFDRLNGAFRMIQEGGAGLIGLGRARYWQGPDGALRLDAGPFVAALEQATGRDALVLGKPAPRFFEAALAGLDLPAAQVALVGDDAETDVRAAMRAGLTGVLVRTGKFREGDDRGSDEAPAPDAVLDSAADVVRDA